MFRNYLSAALRNLARNRLYAGLTIAGLAIGFAAALLIGLYDTHFGWQWIYWQDMILAPIIGGLVWLGTPHEKVDVGLLERADWGGMALLGTGWALIYAGLDQGNRLDWLNSGVIVGLLVAGGAMLLAFVVAELIVEQPLIDFKVAAQPNV
ncbi:MAG: hypothetical protein ACREEG_12915, partial [Phenylobacterium sp.]